MILIVCVDDNRGLAFNNRRQSLDKILREHLLADTKDAVLWMNAYSAEQFRENDMSQIKVDEHFIKRAGAGEFCLVELEMPNINKEIEEIWIYHWNRIYPSDQFFPELDPQKWVRKQTQEFEGNSHEIITKEVYKPCKREKSKNN